MSTTPLGMTRPSVGEVKNYVAVREAGISGLLDTALTTLFRVMPRNTVIG